MKIGLNPLITFFPEGFDIWSLYMKSQVIQNHKVEEYDTVSYRYVPQSLGLTMLTL